MDDETNDDVTDEGLGGAAARVTTPRSYDDKLVITSSSCVSTYYRAIAHCLQF